MSGNVLQREDTECDLHVVTAILRGGQADFQLCELVVASQGTHVNVQKQPATTKVR